MSDPTRSWRTDRASSRATVCRNLALVGFSVAGLFLFVWWMLVAPRSDPQAPRGYDAFAYWSVNILHPYSVSIGGFGAFTYSPVAALVGSLGHLLPFDLFFWLWDAFLLLNLVWLARRKALIWLLFLPALVELYEGNIHLLLASVCVLGFEYPALWSFVLLTKVTPGVGLLWFAVRREWRALGWALGATAAIAAVSFVLIPSAWFDWAKFLATSQNNASVQGYLFESLVPPLWLRIPLAALLVVWGARTNRRWMVPIAMIVAMPVIWADSPVIIVAIPRLLHRTKAPEPGSATAGTPADASSKSWPGRFAALQTRRASSGQ